MQIIYKHMNFKLKSKNQEIEIVNIKRDYISQVRASAKLPMRIPVPFSLNELETVEGIADTLLEKLADRKRLMLTQVDDYRDQIKSTFLAKVDQVTDRLRQLVTDCSKWTFFEQLIYDFFSKKNDFELEQSLDRLQRVSDSVCNLLYVEHYTLFDKFLDQDSLRVQLDHILRLFDESAKKTAGKVSFDKFQQNMEYNINQTYQSTEIININGSEFLNQKTTSDSASVWDGLTQANKIRNKIQETWEMSKQGQLEGQDRAVMEFFTGLRDAKMKQKYKAATPLVSNPQLVLFQANDCNWSWNACTFLKNYNDEHEDSQIFDPINSKQTTHFRLMDVLKKGKEGNLLEFRLKNYNQKLLVSASDRYIAFEMTRKRNWLVCEFTSDFKMIQAIPWKKFDQKFIFKLIFVDHSEGEKLVYIDQNMRLVVFNLAEQQIEFKLENYRIKSLFYLDQEHVFLVEKNIIMGLLWMGPSAQVNWKNYSSDQAPSGFFPIEDGRNPPFFLLS